MDRESTVPQEALAGIKQPKDREINAESQPNLAGAVVDILENGTDITTLFPDPVLRSQVEGHVGTIKQSFAEAQAAGYQGDIRQWLTETVGATQTQETIAPERIENTNADSPIKSESSEPPGIVEQTIAEFSKKLEASGGEISYKEAVKLLEKLELPKPNEELNDLSRGKLNQEVQQTKAVLRRSLNKFIRFLPASIAAAVTAPIGLPVAAIAVIAATAYGSKFFNIVDSKNKIDQMQARTILKNIDSAQNLKTRVSEITAELVKTMQDAQQKFESDQISGDEKEKIFQAIYGKLRSVVNDVNRSAEQLGMSRLQVESPNEARNIRRSTSNRVGQSQLDQEWEKQYGETISNLPSASQKYGASGQVQTSQAGIYNLVDGLSSME